MSKEKEIWIKRLANLKIAPEIHVLQQFKYNNKDFDLTFQLDKIEETRQGKVVIKTYVLNPTPKTYMFRDKEYEYKSMYLSLETLYDYLWRQVLVRL